MIRIVVSGALGRMGKRLIALAEKDSAFQVAGKFEKEAHPEAGIAGGMDKVKGKCDCIIEFTSPAATVEHLAEAKKRKMAMVIGTTGFSEEELKAVREASRVIPVVFSPNMSVGVNVFLSLIGKTAEAFGGDYKVSIKETHHVHKKDKPSGTARLMAETVKEISKGDALVESIREGEVAGDHEIVFESETDILKISHSAKTRDIFALGALRAAKFITKKKKGLFSMRDVLGMSGKR